MKITDKDRLDFLENIICNEIVKDKSETFGCWEVCDITQGSRTSITINYFNIKLTLRDAIDNAIVAMKEKANDET